MRLTFVVLCALGLSAQSNQAVRAPSTPQGYRIAGTVVNSVTGQPVAGVSVAVAPVAQGTDREITRTVTTGSDGRFAFSGLSRGKYSLMAAAHGFMLQYFERHEMFATAIATGPDIDSEHLVFRLQPDASIEGQVIDENNDPIQGAMVHLFQKSTDQGRQKNVLMNQGNTDDLGHFRLGHLAPGTYYLAVSAHPWYAQNYHAVAHYKSNPDTDARIAQEAAALDVTYPLTFYPDSPDSAGASPIVLHPGERMTADVVMRAVPALHLRIRTNNPASSGGGGTGGFPRLSQRIFEGYLDSVAPVFSSIEPGMVEISGLAPGHYVIEMPAKGPSEKGGNRGGYREVDLAGDLELSASDSSGFATVSGSIVFEGDTRLPKNVSLQLANEETGETFGSQISEQGQFDFSGQGMKPGRYSVSIPSRNGLFMRKLSASGAKLVGRTLELSSGSSVRVIATVGHGVAEVDGVALQGDKPVSGAMIVLIPKDPTNNAPLFRRDQSDSDGSFTLPYVVPGQYTVLALMNGWELEWGNPAVLQPYLKAGQTVQVTGQGKLEVKVQVQ